MGICILLLELYTEKENGHTKISAFWIVWSIHILHNIVVFLVKNL